jgi:hypothetical protein
MNRPFEQLRRRWAPSPTPAFRACQCGDGPPRRIEGRLDVTSRLLRLVKWFCSSRITSCSRFCSSPHSLTVFAFFAILLTGRYPRPVFDFNVAVLRWWWQVGFYGYSALGTDRFGLVSIRP